MNKDRRKQIETVKADLSASLAGMEDLLRRINDLRDEEQEYYDNMPESFQCGEKGDAAQEAVNSLEEAATSLEEIMSQADTADGALEQAAQ